MSYACKSACFHILHGCKLGMFIENGVKLLCQEVIVVICNNDRGWMCFLKYLVYQYTSTVLIMFRFYMQNSVDLFVIIVIRKKKLLCNYCDMLDLFATTAGSGLLQVSLSLWRCFF